MVESAIPAAVARIHQLIGDGAATPGAMRDLERAFDTVDHHDCVVEGDALALLSLSSLLLKELVLGQKESIETNGAAQLVGLAWAYLGRAIQELEMKAKSDKIAAGTMEM